MDWLILLLEIAVAIICIVFEVLYFKEKLRRQDEELMYLEHRERWLQICERQKKKIEELEAADLRDVVEAQQAIVDKQTELIETHRENVKMLERICADKQDIIEAQKAKIKLRDNYIETLEGHVKKLTDLIE